jgi:cytoskeletal protein RodZ
MENKNGKQVEIGKSLHDARVSKGMSLEDIQKTTKIQKHYLEAIEQENFDELPGNFYVRAFIKQFADAVGLNGVELLNEHDDDLPDTQSQEYKAEVSGEEVSRRIEIQNKEQRRNALRRYLPTIGIIAGIIVVVGIIWGVVVSTNKSSQTSISSSSVSVTGSSESSSSTVNVKKHKTVKKTNKGKTLIKENSITEYSIKGTKENTIRIKASDRLWSSVTDDGKMLYQGSQNAGEHKDVKLSANTKKVMISLGNVKGSTIYINGKEMQLDKNTPLTTQLTLNFTK